MANILLVDPDEMAQVAMRSILSRANHRCIAVSSEPEAVAFLSRNLKVDMVIVEIKLLGDDGLFLIDHLKKDLCFKTVPVVVYTAHRTRENVRTALALGVQNFLIKPYNDELILFEIAKGTDTPWYKQDFKNAETGAGSSEVPMKRIQCRLDNLRLVLDVARVSLTERLETMTDVMSEEESQSIYDELTMLHYEAEDVGAVGVARCLAFLNEKAHTSSWAEFKYSLPYLDCYSRFIFWHMNPHLNPEEFMSEDELTADVEARSRVLWEKATEHKAYPVVTWEKLQKEVDSLSGCPVMESVAASFHMSANGSPTSLHPLMDLVDKDPGLMTQILITINQLRRQKSSGARTQVEAARMAIGMLGELRLAALGRTLLRVQDGMMQVTPVCSWLRYWMFQLGTARIAESICAHLELPDMEGAAYTAGLIHDIGNLLLLRLHPTAFQTILKYAIENGTSVATAERRHMDVTTHQIATYFADRIGLPSRFANVLRWVHSPELAVEDSSLVAVVAVARHLCRQNGVGFSGNTPKEELLSLENTSAWRALHPHTFPGFQLKRFEIQIRDECKELHSELHGRWNEAKEAAEKSHHKKN